MTAEQQPMGRRPKMDGYGVPASRETVLPWEWARDRFSKSHNYWLTTVRPDGSPHVMPVWGVWVEDAWYFSTSSSSRKARNLEANPNCVVCNETAEEAVIVEGLAQKLNEGDIPQKAFADYKSKYDWELDPKRGPVWKVTPSVVFGIPEKLFPDAVTQWVFRPEPQG